MPFLISEFSALVESNLSKEDFNVESNTRLKKAKYLLKNEDCTIGEVASKTGFSSSAYFSSVLNQKKELLQKNSGKNNS